MDLAVLALPAEPVVVAGGVAGEAGRFAMLLPPVPGAVVEAVPV